jgi:NADH-quinone oxidoreductase subunit N
MMNVSPRDWLMLTPEMILFGTAVIVLMLDAFLRKPKYRPTPWIALAGALASLAAAALLWNFHRAGFGGMIVVDNFSVLVKGAVLTGAALAILVSVDYVRREELPEGEYYALLLMSCIGMTLMASSANLIMVFLSLETLSIALYVMTGIARVRPKSQEAGMKYFLLGSFSAAILVYGVALIYGATGTVDLRLIADALAGHGVASNPLLLAGTGLVLVGLAFKVAVVPFQMWTPDVYEGAPSPVTAFMSVATKATAFAVLTRFLVFALHDLRPEWIAAIWVMAALTMVVGNVVAIAQSSIKRMLAYSSIAHAGYILAALAASNKIGTQSVAFYLIAYVFMNIGAWAVVTSVTKKGEGSVELSDYSGLFRSNPWLATAMALFMFSLAGLPPTAGFMAKIYIILAALSAKMIGLVAIIIFTSLISAYYYLRVTVLMFMERPEEPPSVKVPIPTAIAISIAAIATIGLFLFPTSVQAFAETVAKLLL